MTTANADPLLKAMRNASLGGAAAQRRVSNLFGGFLFDEKRFGRLLLGGGHQRPAGGRLCRCRFGCRIGG